MQHVLNTKLSRPGKDGLAFLMGNGCKWAASNYVFRFFIIFDVMQQDCLLNPRRLIIC